MHESHISNSPIPFTRNKAKGKLRAVIGKFVNDELNVRLNSKMISDEDLSYFFTHENGGSFYLKTQYHFNNDKIISYINMNQNNFSFLKVVPA